MSNEQSNGVTNGHSNGHTEKVIKHFHTFVVYVEDAPGVLNRISSLFRRRAYNIETLNAGRTDIPGVSRMTIVMEADAATARLVEANLYKSPCVLRVENVTLLPALERELAFIKVKADSETRAQVTQLIDLFRARVVDVTSSSLIAEITGTEDKIQGLVEVLQPFGIIEMVRSGIIAMTRGAESVPVNPNFVEAEIPGESQ
jgi:acetolactate synthase-1/3 small subunit